MDDLRRFRIFHTNTVAPKGLCIYGLPSNEILQLKEISLAAGVCVPVDISLFLSKVYGREPIENCLPARSRF